MLLCRVLTVRLHMTNTSEKVVWLAQLAGDFFSQSETDSLQIGFVAHYFCVLK